MEYKLFDEYITLQALLKTTGILHSGGAIKEFLATQTVLFNGIEETRRGKKIRMGDCITLPSQGLHITIIAPTPEEKAAYQADLAEKERVAAIVKRMNKENKKAGSKPVRKESVDSKPVRFPGT